MRIRRKMAEETNKEELPKNGSEGGVDFQELAAGLMKRVESLEKSLEQCRKEEKASHKKTEEGPLNSMVSGRSGKVCSAGPGNRSTVIKEG